ncbi:hypothetical protein PGB90_005997 [Kerria lacca]
MLMKGRVGLLFRVEKYRIAGTSSRLFTGTDRYRLPRPFSPYAHLDTYIRQPLLSDSRI